MERQLWNYIDGACTASDEARIRGLIAADAKWKALYGKLKALHITASGMEPEQPSMRFTKNIMEAIGHTAIAPPARRYVNPMVVRVIAGFFIIVIALLLVYALGGAVPSGGATTDFPEADLGAILNSKVFHAVAWANMVAGMLLLDSLLRKKRMAKAGN